MQQPVKRRPWSAFHLVTGFAVTTFFTCFLTRRLWALNVATDSDCCTVEAFLFRAYSVILVSVCVGVDLQGLRSGTP